MELAVVLVTVTVVLVAVAVVLVSVFVVDVSVAVVELPVVLVVCLQDRSRCWLPGTSSRCPGRQSVHRRHVAWPGWALWVPSAQGKHWRSDQRVGGALSYLIS